MTPSLCVCGAEHPLPDDDRALVWFLHPDNHDFAQRLLAAGHAAVPCAAVPRSHVITLHAQTARGKIGTMNPAEIVEEAVFP